MNGVFQMHGVLAACDGFGDLATELGDDALRLELNRVGSVALHEGYATTVRRGQVRTAGFVCATDGDWHGVRRQNRGTMVGQINDSFRCTIGRRKQKRSSSSSPETVAVHGTRTPSWFRISTPWALNVVLLRNTSLASP